jgi:hypothetical protein
MMKKKFIRRRCVHKVSRSSLVHSPRAAIVAAASSGKSSSTSSSLSASSSFGVREALAVEKAPLVRTSAPVQPLRKEYGLAAAPVANLIPISLVDATSAGVNLIILSSDSEDEVDWEALAAEDEVDWETLVALVAR